MKVVAGAEAARGGSGGGCGCGGGWDGSVVIFEGACVDDDALLRFAVYRASSAKVARGVMGEIGGRVGDCARGWSEGVAGSVLFVRMLMGGGGGGAGVLVVNGSDMAEC